MAQVLGFLPPTQGTWMEFLILAAGWPCPGCGGHLDSEAAGISVSLCLSRRRE